MSGEIKCRVELDKEWSESTENTIMIERHWYESTCPILDNRK